MSKYKEVYNNIKKQIKDGKLKPKDYLKKEADFAKDFNELAIAGASPSNFET